MGPIKSCPQPALDPAHNPHHSVHCAQADIRLAYHFSLATGRAAGRSSELHDLIWGDYGAPGPRGRRGPQTPRRGRRRQDPQPERAGQGLHRRLAQGGRLGGGKPPGGPGDEGPRLAGRGGEAPTCIRKTSSTKEQAVPAVVPPVEELSSTAAPVVVAPVQETPSTSIQTNHEAANPNHGTAQARVKLPGDASSGNKTTRARVKLPDAAGQTDRPQPQPQPEAARHPPQTKSDPLKAEQMEFLKFPKQGEKRLATGPPSPERAAKREWGAMPDVQEIEPFSIKQQRNCGRRCISSHRAEITGPFDRWEECSGTPRSVCGPGLGLRESHGKGNEVAGVLFAERCTRPMARPSQQYPGPSRLTWHLERYDLRGLRGNWGGGAALDDFTAEFVSEPTGPTGPIRKARSTLALILGLAI
ncbi:hypothetical protein CMUS01_07043 [Colletotrichum musicola]|uniref:Uncharacterized protein n=1 Tax=Colletotrichum musicola TaxID=2175873 RepID=A0A8H6NG38_9PEZI|nr:hypothetical protein CMUS01_07043 [Colletotrichum musicola]